jgi:DnaJ domain
MTRRKRIRYDPANDLYSVLGLSPSATAEEIRRSFRQRAKAVHPDLNPKNADWAHQQFQRLNDAYDILSDPSLRTEYDQRRNVYYRHRGADGLAWWERPNPTAEGRRRGDSTSGVPFTDHNRRRTWNTMRRKRRQRTRSYEVLFVLSAIMLGGSLCAWIVGIPGRYASTAGNVAIVPGSSDTPAADGLCSDQDAVITSPANGANIPGRFSIRGTATSGEFAFYTLDITSLSHASSTAALVTLPVISLIGSTPVRDGLLAADGIIGNLAPGDYTLRLTVTLAGGKKLAPCEVRIHHTAS